MCLNCIYELMCRWISLPLNIGFSDNYRSQFQPLFLYLPHQAPHNGNGPSLDTSLRAPYEYIQRFSHIKDKHRRIYAGTCSWFAQHGCKIQCLILKKITVLDYKTRSGWHLWELPSRTVDTIDIMACRLNGTITSAEPVLTYCQLGPWGHN